MTEQPDDLDALESGLNLEPQPSEEGEAWRVALAKLEQVAPEHWAPPGDPRGEPELGP